MSDWPLPTLDTQGFMAEVGQGILVTSWLGGNTDSTTGDFSMGCRGFLIVGGLDLFRQLRRIGNDPFRYASLQAPTLVFEDVSFSGA